MVRKALTAILIAAASISAIYAQENKVTRLPETNRSNVQKDYADNNTGFWIAAEAGAAYSCRLFNSNFGFTEVDLTAGYRFNEYLRIGAGIGGRVYFDNSAVRKDASSWAFPIFANVRGNFIPTQYRTVVPYYSVDIGGTIRDGFMFRPSVGIRIGQQRNAFIVSLGYLNQRLSVAESANRGKSRNVSFISIRLGYEF